MTLLHKIPSRPPLPLTGKAEAERRAPTSEALPAAPVKTTVQSQPEASTESSYTERPGLNGNEDTPRGALLDLGARLRGLAERAILSARAEKSFPEVQLPGSAKGGEAQAVRGAATPELPVRDHEKTVSTITLGEDVTLDQLKLKLDIAHTYPRDLVVSLTSPDGTTHTVVNREGGRRRDLIESFDLPAFQGTQAKGDWTLTVEDKARGDSGTLRGWVLEGTGAAPAAEEPSKPFPQLEGPPVVVVIDGGIETTHLDLVDGLWVNQGEIPGDGIDNDGNGYVDDVHGINVHLGNGALDKADGVDHGTHVAGIVVAADNNKGNTGLAAGSALVMGIGGIYDAEDSLVAFEQAVDYIVDQKVNRGVNVRVVNASFGEEVGDKAKLARWDAAVAKLRDVDILVVAATDNGNGSNMDNVPNDRPSNAELANMIVVASMDAKLEKLAGFSSYGPQSVDLAAAGQDILSTTLKNRWTRDSGTSYATPQVAATAALMFEAHPGLTAVEARQIILDTVTRLPSLEGKVATGGMLNTESAVEAARELGERARAQPGEASLSEPAAVAWG